MSHNHQNHKLWSNETMFLTVKTRRTLTERHWRGAVAWCPCSAEPRRCRGGAPNKQVSKLLPTKTNEPFRPLTVGTGTNVYISPGPNTRQDKCKGSKTLSMVVTWFLLHYVQLISAIKISRFSIWFGYLDNKLDILETLQTWAHKLVSPVDYDVIQSSKSQTMV